jgi:hypothetical protein
MLQHRMSHITLINKERKWNSLKLDIKLENRHQKYDGKQQN